MYGHKRQEHMTHRTDNYDTFKTDFMLIPLLVHFKVLVSMYYIKKIESYIYIYIRNDRQFPQISGMRNITNNPIRINRGLHNPLGGA